MKKRVLSLLAACAVITTSFVGLLQNVYAEGHNVRIVVSDTDTDTEKTLKFYYEGTGADGLVAFNADLTISEGTIKSFALSAVNPAYKGSSNNYTGNLWFSDDNGAPSADGEFATATVTVPTDKDVTVSLKVNEFYDSDDWEDYSTEVGTVTATIPAKPAATEAPTEAPTPTVAPTEAPTEAPDPVNIVKQNKNKVITGTGEYESQKADIYGVEVTPVDQKAITGAKVTFDDQHSQEYRTGTKITEGSIIFAVILVSESGAELPELTDAKVTPIFATEEE